MTALADRDYFTDFEILADPYAFFEAVREKGPFYQPEGRNYLIVTGFQEILEIMRNSADFSAVNALQGAALPLPFQPQGPDITTQIEAHRSEFHGGDLVVNLDDKPHTNLRSLVNRLFIPSRLKANEKYFAAFADNMVRDAVAKGEIELVRNIATPFVTLVVADLLGVPEEDRKMFMDAIQEAPCPGNLEGDKPLDAAGHPFVLMGSYFAGYVQDRAANPRGDVLSELTHAKYPDGTAPDVTDIVKLGMFMFGAGQDTSAKLLSNAIRYIVDEPGLQEQLRADPSLVPALLEEVLRLEGSSKQTARLARKDTTISGHPIPAGTGLLLSLQIAIQSAGKIRTLSCSIGQRSRNIWPSDGAPTPARVLRSRVSKSASSSKSFLVKRRTSISTTASMVRKARVDSTTSRASLFAGFPSFI
jgi:cytochrome P450